MAPPPEDGSPGGVTLVQVLWGAAALLGILWGLLVGAVGWIFVTAMARLKELGDRLHKVEGEQAAQAPMVQELWLDKRERDKKEES